MFKRILFGLLFLSLTISIAFYWYNYSSNDLTQSDQGQISLRQEWMPYSGFAGEILASKKYAPARGLSLDIRPGSEAYDPIKMVMLGKDDFGVVGADVLISQIAKGAPLIAIGVVNAVSPTCFLTKLNSDILQPLDFKGHTIGILTGTNTERIYRLLMKRNGIRTSEVTEVAASFDLNGFILNEYDVRPAFIYDEPVTLNAKQIKYNVIKPSDFGVSILGTVYFTTLDKVKNRPDIVSALVASLYDGWLDVANSAGQEEAIQRLKQQFPEIDDSRELESLRLGLPYFLGFNNKPLCSSVDQWKSTIAALQELGEVNVPLGVEQVWDESFTKSLCQ